MSDHFDTRAARLAAALDDFLSSSPDVEAAAVVSFDGLPMASGLPDDLDEERVGAMSAALLSLGEQAALGLGRGQLNQVFVEGEHGFVFLMSCRDQAVLAAVAARRAKIGFMLFEMRQAAERIGTLLAPDTDVDLPAPDVRPWAAAAPADLAPSPVEQVVEAFAAPGPAPFDAPAGLDASAPFEAPAPSEARAPAAFEAPAPAPAPAPMPEAFEAPTPEPERYVPATPEPIRHDESPFATLGELRAVSAAPTAPAPTSPYAAPPAPDGSGNEADLLGVLATEQLAPSDDHELLTEALFEVRRATGGDSALHDAWRRQESTSANG